MGTDDTAPSEHGADAETAHVPPPPPADAPELAWSADDDTDDAPANRHGRLIWAGLSVLVVAVTAALVLLVSTLFSLHNSDTTKPQPIPSPPKASSTATAAPAPPTVTAAPPVTVTPPPPTPILSAKDRKFIADLRQNEALGDLGTNTPAVLADAQYVCDEMQSGGDPAELHSRLHAVWPSIAENDVTWFLYTSTAVYCPQIGGPV
jgi:hypothetical protein